MSYQLPLGTRTLDSHLDPARPGHNYPIMRKRSLGGTGIVVGEIGLGSAPLGRLTGNVVPDKEALEILGMALDMQASFIDTAPTYGAGRAESLIGQVVGKRRSQAVLSTKAGYFYDGHVDYSPAAVRSSLEASLKRLATDHVDVLFLHNPGANVLVATDPIWAELEKLKSEGKLRAFGVSLTSPELLKLALDKTPAQVLQFPYNVFFQDNGVIFESATAKRVGLVVNRPLDSGFLSGAAGKLSFFNDERARFSRADIARRVELSRQVEFMASPAVRMTQAALSFALAHSQVSCVIPGASDWHHVIDNVDANQHPLSSDTIARLKEFWEKNIKGSSLAL